MKLLLLLVLGCLLFPEAEVRLSQGLLALAPTAEAFMPCIIVLAGLYLLVKSVLK